MKKTNALFSCLILVLGVISMISIQEANAVVVTVTHHSVKKCIVTGSKGWACFFVSLDVTPPVITPPCVDTKYSHTCNTPCVDTKYSHTCTGTPTATPKASLVCKITGSKGWICYKEVGRK